MPCATNAVKAIGGRATITMTDGRTITDELAQLSTALPSSALQTGASGLF